MSIIPYAACLLLIVSLGFTSHQGDLNSSSNNDDARFKRFSDSLINRYWQWHPSWATAAGNAAYDNILEVPTTQWLQQRANEHRRMLGELNAFENKKLSTLNRIDYKMLRNLLEYQLWSFTEFRSHEWNPAGYNVGRGFDLALSRPDLPLRKRLENVKQRLAYVNDFYRAATDNITNPTAEHIQLAIQQNNGALFVFEKMIPDSIRKLNDPALAKQMEPVLAAATAGIKRYINFLEKYPLRSNVQFRDFRIGAEMFSKKFDYEIQSRFTAEEIYNTAVKRKAEIHTEMIGITQKLWPKYFGSDAMPDGLAAVHRMIDTLSTHHVHRDSFMHAIEKQIPELEAFVREKNLLYIDPTKPLIVREMPAYMEGSGAGASINSPGPYNPNDKTYYNVTLLTHYTPEQAESYLREYNDYILQILNIHEAIPGHYTQLVYANRSPSLVKSLFGNGAMIEGWAVYTERMMLEAGYKATDEMWLMWYKWHLRSVINTILDYSIHCLGMTEQQGKEMMINEGFQQQAEADGKWKRATLSQVQLCSYFTGFTEIWELREELKQKQGASFNLKKFHETFLSFGNAPVKYIREAMWNN